MKLRLGNNNNTVDFKPLVSLDSYVGVMEQTKYGENYYFIGVNKEDKFSNLLIKYDETENFKIYLDKKMLYFIISEAEVHYVFHIEEDENNLYNQIKKDKKIIIALYKDLENIDNIFACDIIME